MTIHVYVYICFHEYSVWYVVSVGSINTLFVESVWTVLLVVIFTVRMAIQAIIAHKFDAVYSWNMYVFIIST